MATEEQRKKIIELWNSDKSLSDIAKECDLSRGTVAGIVHRARIKDGSAKAKTPPKNFRKPGEATMEEPKKEITVYQLKRNQCKYPTVMSDDNEQLFCGKPTNRIYCDYHHALCHTTREPYIARLRAVK